MAEDISWDDYNAHQQGREPRPLLRRALALDATTQRPTDRTPVAIDLGCGEGVETVALLAAGWRVHAVDGEPAALDRLSARVDGAAADRLHVRRISFEDVRELPAADLVHASYALPYCPPEAFGCLWSAVRSALRPGALLACQLFGDRDSMAGTPGMTFHTRAQAEALLDGLEVLDWREEDEPGTSFTGPKHWHVFHVIARRT